MKTVVKIIMDNEGEDDHYVYENSGEDMDDEGEDEHYVYEDSGEDMDEGEEDHYEDGGEVK